MALAELGRGEAIRGVPEAPPVRSRAAAAHEVRPPGGEMRAIVLMVCCGSLTLAGSRALAVDYTPDEMCSAIGETPNVAVPPLDRIYFKKNCACVPRHGC